MSETYTNTLLDIGGFVGTPIDGWPTHGEPAPNRNDIYRSDPLTTNIVDELCDGLLESDATSVACPTEWVKTTVQPELYWVQRWIGGEWKWRKATRPSHLSQFVSTHRVDPNEDGWTIPPDLYEYLTALDTDKMSVMSTL